MITAENITHIKQKTPRACGQTCVAMLCGKPVKEAWKFVGHVQGTHGTDIIRAVQKLGFKCPDRMLRYSPYLPLTPLPDVCLLWCKVYLMGKLVAKHWVLKVDKTYFDPSEDAPSAFLNRCLEITYYVPLEEAAV